MSNYCSRSLKLFFHTLCLDLIVIMPTLNSLSPHRRNSMFGRITRVFCCIEPAYKTYKPEPVSGVRLHEACPSESYAGQICVLAKFMRQPTLCACARRTTALALHSALSPEDVCLSIASLQNECGCDRCVCMVRCLHPRGSRVQTPVVSPVRHSAVAPKSKI